MFTKFFNEARQFFRIAIPIYGAQMSYGGIYMTDTIVAGRAGSHELAGVALAASVSSPIFFSLSGIFFGLSPIVAHLNGARKFQSIKIKMRESLWITVAIGLVLMALYGLSPLLLGLTRIDTSITSISASYLGILAFAAIPMMWYTWLRCFSEGLTITKPVFAVAFTAMLLNIPLDIIFVYGYFGFEPMGGPGCALATLAIYIYMAIAMTLIVFFKKEYVSFNFFRKFRLPTFKTATELIRLGLPIGIGIFIEVSMFSGIAILLGPLGEVTLASHSIALSVASFLFMLPLSLGLASATRVGNLLGAKRYNDAKYSIATALKLTTSVAVINMAVLIFFSSVIISLFTSEVDVYSLALELVLLAAIFQIPDGIQVGILGSLRGYKDTYVPMLLLAFTYWVVALPFGYFLTYHGFGSPMGASGMWYAMILGLVIFALLISFRIKLVMQKYLDQKN